MFTLVGPISLAVFALFLFPVENDRFAQQTFEIKSRSARYDIEIKIDRCDEERKQFAPSDCAGPGQVSIYRKGSPTPFQLLELKNIEVHKDQLVYDAEIDKHARKLYDDEYSFVFDDFNFDANEDLAVCNGRNGGYGGPSYNVYLYDVKLRKFVLNAGLSKLTEDTYLGLFSVEPRKRQLVAKSKSGCCYHETEMYRVVRNRPLLVEKVIEEASGSDDTGYVVVITTRKLVNGRWIKRVTSKKYKEEPPSQVRE